MAEIEVRIRQLAPKPADFRFVAPSEWSINLAAGRPLVTVVPAAAGGGSEALVDEDGYTTWVLPLSGGTPEAVFDLGELVSFDRVVMFNRRTDARGTGGGNNAASRIGLSGSTAVSGPWREITVVELQGPAPICFRRGRGEACSSIVPSRR